MFTPELTMLASEVLAKARAAGLKIATAESCTGGLVAGLLTEIPGSSDVFERGFVTYSNDAKRELLGVPEDLLQTRGAVSAEVAGAMARGALEHAAADAAIAVTGIAGPGGGTKDKPVGLVFIAASRGGELRMEEHRFGDPGRSEIRLRTVEAALRLLASLL
jgi:nicotinamide-nucleotide amidase